MTVLLIGPASPATDDVRRLAAATGVTLSVTTDLADAMTGWLAARAVVVEHSWLATLARLNPERRERVVIVSSGSLTGDDWKDAMSLGACEVWVLPEDGPNVTAFLQEAGTDHAAPLVALVSGCGGAGATVLAASMAILAADSVDTLLVETDPLSAGAMAVLGFTGLPGVSWLEVAESGTPSPASLHHNVPRRGQLGVLTWRDDARLPLRPEPPELAVELVRGTLNAARASHDAVVVDLDRHQVALVRAVAMAAVQVVVVAHGQPRCLEAAARVVRLAGSAHTRLVVRAKGNPLRPHEVTRLTGVHDVHFLPEVRRLDEHLTLSLGPLARRGALHAISRDVWSAVLA